MCFVTFALWSYSVWTNFQVCCFLRLSSFGDTFSGNCSRAYYIYSGSCRHGPLRVYSYLAVLVVIYDLCLPNGGTGVASFRTSGVILLGNKPKGFTAPCQSSN